jgi:D-serine deaminase-like pyridoxal phosphate-dependent protein
MPQPPPAEPGMREDEVDTPALLLDLDAFEHNLDAWPRCWRRPAKLRAHAKTHKSPVVALAQMRRGAVGQCVQKVAEAEALAWGGVPGHPGEQRGDRAAQARAARGAVAHRPRRGLRR